MVNLSGKVALITGASSGIGAATAIHFASLGCSVAINGRNTEKLRKVSAQCLANCPKDTQVLIVSGDISKEDEAIKVVEKTIDHFGTLDILVNNAGIGVAGTLETTSLSDFDRVTNTNLRAVFHMTQLCAPHLKKAKGNVVNVSSVASYRGLNHLQAYSIAKAGVDNFTKTSARELAKDGVRVNVVNPGLVATDLFENMGVPKEELPNIYENFDKLQALGRVGKSEEIAKAIAFLASDDGSFITGSSLLVDGGFNLLGPEVKL